LDMTNRKTDVSSLVAPAADGETECTVADMSLDQVQRVTTNAGALQFYYELLLDRDVDMQPRPQGFHSAELAQQAARAFYSPGSDGTWKRPGKYIMYQLHPQWKEADGCFKRDGRGSHTKDFILNEEDLQARFVKWMMAKNAKYFTIDMAVTWVNSAEFMDTPDMRALLEQYQVAYPVAKSVVYSWIQKAGGTCEKHQQCYYTGA